MYADYVQFGQLDPEMFSTDEEVERQRAAQEQARKAMEEFTKEEIRRKRGGLTLVTGITAADAFIRLGVGYLVWRSKAPKWIRYIFGGGLLAGGTLGLAATGVGVYGLARTAPAVAPTP